MLISFALISLIKMFIQLSKVIVFIVILFAFTCHEIESQTIPPCGFENIDYPQDSPYVIPAISDNLDADPINFVWIHPLYGNINRTAATSSEQVSYISAYYSPSPYRIAPNSLTKSFTRRFGRIMNRTVNVYCDDNPFMRYPINFIIPFQDMTRPTFNKMFFNITVSKDWDRPWPISGGDFIIATDNAFEIEKNPNFIKFTTSDPEYIKVVPVPLWLSQSEYYSYRLDVYFQEGAMLEIGVKNVTVAAHDEFSSAETTIQIEVN